MCEKPFRNLPLEATNLESFSFLICESHIIVYVAVEYTVVLNHQGLWVFFYIIT